MYVVTNGWLSASYVRDNLWCMCMYIFYLHSSDDKRLYVLAIVNSTKMWMELELFHWDSHFLFFADPEVGWLDCIIQFDTLRKFYTVLQSDCVS